MAQRRWRDFRTAAGKRPVREFLLDLSDEDAASVLVLLSLDGFSKKTQKTPPEKIRLAERRLADWRRRG